MIYLHLFLSMRILAYMNAELAETGVGEAPRWELYRSLADPLRLELLALVSAEEFTLGELAVLVAAPQPKVSRQMAALRSQGLVRIRKEGTRAWAILEPSLRSDPVICDALVSGTRLSEANGSLDRVPQVLEHREQMVRDYFKEASPAHGSVTLPPALRVYVAALRALIPRAELAVDVGTGDGTLLELLAPLFRRIIAIDREPAQLARVRARLREQGDGHVELWEMDYTDPALLEPIVACGGADAVFAVRVLHHAARPSQAMAALAAMARQGGRVVVLDYQLHQDETLRAKGDVWLGFEPHELQRLAQSAGLKDVDVLPLAAPQGLGGADGHLAWQILSATKE